MVCNLEMKPVKAILDWSSEGSFGVAIEKVQKNSELDPFGLSPQSMLWYDCHMLVQVHMRINEDDAHLHVNADCSYPILPACLFSVFFGDSFLSCTDAIIALSKEFLTIEEEAPQHDKCL